VGGLEPKDSPPGLAVDLVRRVQSDGCSLVGRLDRPYAATVLADEAYMGEAGPRRVVGPCKNSGVVRPHGLPPGGTEPRHCLGVPRPTQWSKRVSAGNSNGPEEARGGRR
jgi:hypothetical protein